MPFFASVVDDTTRGGDTLSAWCAGGSAMTSHSTMEHVLDLVSRAHETSRTMPSMQQAARPEYTCTHT